jgi:hypothetical protein
MRRVLDRRIGFIDTLFTQLGATGITHTHTHYGSQSSLVVSWQRIYDSLTVTSDHHEVYFSQHNSCHYSEDSTQFNSSVPKLISRQAGVSKLDSTTISPNMVSLLLGRQLLDCCSRIAMGMCLPNRCLAMNVCSDFALAAFWRRVSYVLSDFPSSFP